MTVTMMSGDEPVKAFISDPVLQKRLAKYLALKCFRNSMLEDWHAGRAPDSKCGDYSDVVVQTPFGEIPWRDLSRFNDLEMKTLMVNVTNVTYHLIQELFDEQRGGELLLKLAMKDPAPHWDDPL
jgi:ligand-binding SRPBCC domain-containing protein